MKKAIADDARANKLVKAYRAVCHIKLFFNPLWEQGAFRATDYGNREIHPEMG